MEKYSKRPEKENVVFAVAFALVPQLQSFLKFVSLQVGISIITFYYSVGAMCSIMANMTMLDPSMPVSCVLIATLNSFIIVTWIIAISGSFSENKLQIKMALILWSLFVGIWIFCVAFTFLKFDTQILCLDHRCPESFWVYNNTYYKMKSFKPIMRPPTTTPMSLMIPLKFNEIFPTPVRRNLVAKLEPYLKTEENENISVKEKNQSALIGLAEGETTTEEDLSLDTMPQNITTEEEMDPVFNFWTNNTTGFIISVFMITKNLIIMIYSWLVLVGYYQEMICIEDCMWNDGELTDL